VGQSDQTAHRLIFCFILLCVTFRWESVARWAWLCRSIAIFHEYPLGGIAALAQHYGCSDIGFVTASPHQLSRVLRVQTEVYGFCAV
jgi:hypothetical protein